MYDMELQRGEIPSASLSGHLSLVNQTFDEQSDVLLLEQERSVENRDLYAKHFGQVAFPATLEGLVDRRIVQAGCTVSVDGQKPIDAYPDEYQDGDTTVPVLKMNWDTPTIQTLKKRGEEVLVESEAYKDENRSREERVRLLAARKLIDEGVGYTKTFHTETMQYYGYLRGLSALNEPYITINDMNCRVLTSVGLDQQQVIAYGIASLRMEREDEVLHEESGLPPEYRATPESDVQIISNEKVLQWSSLSGFIINERFGEMYPEYEVEPPEIETLAEVIPIRSRQETQYDQIDESVRATAGY